MAKWIEWSKRDVQAAEDYYLEAIKEGDRKISAIKDLASLYQQMNQPQKAVKLLELHREEIMRNGEKRSFNNLFNSVK